MQEYWKRIERRFSALGCLNEMALLPGADENEIADLERRIGIINQANKAILRYFYAWRIIGGSRLF